MDAKGLEPKEPNGTERPGLAWTNEKVKQSIKNVWVKTRIA